MVECEWIRRSQNLTGAICFNRYMVECEYIHRFFACPIQTVLIDTWWNVNTINLQATGLRIYGFNRYMVECE